LTQPAFEEPVKPNIPLLETKERDFEINSEELKIGKTVGSGNFGVVYQGEWRGGIVAIKQLLIKQQVSPTESEKELVDFLAEAAIMKRLRPHTNVVQFLGITTKPHLCIVAEFLANGSLQSYLQNVPKLDVETIIKFVTGIAAGMYHLHFEGIVHRDLATRNVLLNQGLVPKISDFGLSRVFNSTEANIQNQTKSTVGPLRWMAPESLNNRMYSNKSDSWSFGMTLIEIITHDVPFAAVNAMDVARFVASGQKLILPPACPILTNLMNRCSEFVPEKRPDFNEVLTLLREASVQDWQI